MSETMEPWSARRQLWRWWGWMLLATVAFSLVASIRYFAVADLDGAPASLLFRAAMLIAHFSLVSALLLLPVLLIALLLPYARLIIPLGILCAVLIIVALLIDTQVYRLYRFHINAGVLNLLFGGAAKETFVFPAAMYAQAGLIAGSIAGVLTLAAVGAWKYVQRTRGSPQFARVVFVLLALAVVGFHGTHIWADIASREELLRQTEVLPLRYAATAKRFLRSVGVEVRRERQPFAKVRSGGPLQYPLHPLQCEASASPPNIIVVMIDSWRFDALSAAITPNIAAFSQRTLRFTDHYSGGNATRIGVFSFFYSIPGTYWHSMLNDRQGPVVVDELLRQNYDISVFRSAPLYSPEFDRTVFANVNDVRMRSEGKDPAEWDRDLTNDFVSYLEKRDSSRPFFAWLFYDSAHSFKFPKDYPLAFQPSIANVNYIDLGKGSDPVPWINRYHNSLHYVDSLAGEALAALEKKGLLENSVIVITGDHGQEFNDNNRNYWGHASNFTRYQTGVPLLVYSPTITPGTVDHRTTHFDVVPTLMHDYLGCKDPFESYSVGRPLLQPGGRDTLVFSEYAEFAIVEPDLIAVVREQGFRVMTPDYGDLDDDSLSADSVRSALEQKTRFYRRTGAGMH